MNGTTYNILHQILLLHDTGHERTDHLNGCFVILRQRRPEISLHKVIQPVELNLVD